MKLKISIFAVLISVILLGTTRMSAAGLHSFPGGIEPRPMIIEDSIGGKLLLRSSQGFVLLNRSDASMQKVEIPSQYSKYSYFSYLGKDNNGNAMLRISDGKNPQKLTVDADGKVLSAAPYTGSAAQSSGNPNDELKDWTAADSKAWMKEGVNSWQRYRVYSPERKYNVQFTLKYYKKDKKTGDTKVTYDVDLYRTGETTKLATYSKQWTVFTAKNQLFPSLHYQHDIKVSDDGHVLGVVTYDVLRASEQGGFFTSKSIDDWGESKIIVYSMAANGQPKEAEYVDFDKNHLLSTIKVISHDESRIHFIGWYRNKDNEKGYQGLYNMIIDNNAKHIDVYNKVARDIPEKEFLALTSFACNGFNKDVMWYKYADGYRHIGLGYRIPCDAFVTNDGQISVSDFNVYTRSAEGEKWISANTPHIKKVTIPLGFDEKAQAYNFVMIDCGKAMMDGNGVYYKALEDDNGVYFLTVSKDKYLREHVHPILDFYSFQRIYRSNGGHLNRITNVIVDYSILPVSPTKILLFAVAYDKKPEDSGYVFEELTVPDISLLPSDEEIKSKSAPDKPTGAGLTFDILTTPPVK